MAVPLPLPESFYDDVKAVVAADGKLNRALLGISKHTQNAWAALRNIASGEINDDDAMRTAHAFIRSERRDDARLRKLYQDHQETIDTLAPKKRGLCAWVMGG